MHEFLSLNAAFIAPQSESADKRPEMARAVLKAKGWSLRSAAPVLGCHWMHLHKVLNGERRSGRLYRQIIALPTRPKPQRMKPLKKAA